VLTIVGIAVMLVVLNVQLAVPVLAAMPVLWLLTRWFRDHSERAYRATRDAIALVIVHFVESLGGIQAPQKPEDPIVLLMEHVPCEPGKTLKEQHAIGRVKLMQTSYETFERKVREQLSRVLGQGGFDAARDIVAITVNRWSHGYAYSYNSLYDPMDWTYTSTDTRPCVVGRKPFGPITIANSDAAASSHTDAAILMAYEAVTHALKRAGG